MSDLKQLYEFRVGQTSKGIWYCDKITVVGKTASETAVSLNMAMTQVEKSLDEHNKTDEKADNDENIPPFANKVSGKILPRIKVKDEKKYD